MNRKDFINLVNKNSRKRQIRKFPPPLKNAIYTILDIPETERPMHKKEKVKLEIIQIENTYLLSITHKNINKVIRFATGVGNGVKYINISNMISFLDKLGMSEELKEYYLKVHFGDKTTDGTGKYRMSSIKLKAKYFRECSLINNFFDEHRLEIVKFALLNINDNIEVDGILHINDKDQFVFSKTESIKLFAEQYDFESKSLLHSSFLSIQNSARNSKTAPNGYKKAQFKFHNMRDVLLQINKFAKKTPVNKPKGNKGDWGELIAITETTINQSIFVIQETENAYSKILTPIKSILINSKNGVHKFVNNGKEIEVFFNGKLLQKKSLKSFKTLIEEIQCAISKTTKTPFSIPKISTMLYEMKIEDIKKNSKHKDDILIEIDTTKGYNVKSEYGNPATYLNAGATVFLFKVSNISKEQANEINDAKLSKFDVINKIIEIGGTIEFENIKNENFKTNLSMFGETFPKDLAEVILHCAHYNNKNICYIVRQMLKDSAISQSQFKTFKESYSRFMEAICLGMMPSIIWDGTFEADGGLLIINPQTPSYIIPRGRALRDYLYYNTKIDLPDDKRHPTAKLYEENGEFYFHWPLQIRSMSKPSLSNIKKEVEDEIPSSTSFCLCISALFNEFYILEHLI